MGKRKSRQEINLEEEELLNYIDPLQYGSDKDPCFGKLYSLTASECRICGDSVFCANKANLRLNSMIAIEETKFEPQDKEIRELEIAAVKKYVKDKLELGRRPKLIFKMAKNKYKLPSNIINQIIKNTQNGQ